MAMDLVPASLQRLVPWRKDDFYESFLKSRDRLFKDFFSEMSPFVDLAETRTEFVPRIDMTETEEKIMVTAELPGLSDKDVEINLSGDYLNIKGHKKEEKTSKSANCYVAERRFGAFERSMRLPAEVEKDKIAANFADGVLSIDIPKSAEAKQAVKKIPIKH